MSEPMPTLRPDDIKSYLSSRGWLEEGTWRDAAVWEMPEFGRILLPSRREFPDDDDLLTEAVQKLARHEQRTELEVLLDIAEPDTDTQTYRLLPDSPSGTIPLLAGLKAVQGVHDALRAAARFAGEGPHLLFEGQRSRAVADFLERVRLGSAKPGSYVMTARVPVYASEQLSFFEEQLSGRNVMLKMHQAILIAHSTAKEVTSGRAQLEIFDDEQALEAGVSANLCAALGDLGGTGRDRPFEIGFSWARSLQQPEPTPALSFTGPMARVLGKAASELDSLAKSGTARIIGRVKTLDQRDRVKVVGDVQLGRRDEPIHRGIWVRVSPREYDLAYGAQVSGQEVEAAGRLTRTDRRFELQPDSAGLFLSGN